MADVIEFPTITVGEGEDAREVKFRLIYNDSLIVTTLECDNGSDQNAFGKVVGWDANGQPNPNAAYGNSFPPGVSVIAIPDAPANKRISLSANPERPGKFKGFNFENQVPG